MGTFLTVAHVLGAVFIVGPMAILPMTALRALRAGNTAQVAVLTRSISVFSYLSLLVFLLGFGVLGVTGREKGISVTTPWVLISILAYAAALVVTLLVVVPALRRAANVSDGASAAQSASAASVPSKPAGYGAVAAGSGVAALLLVVVVMLMAWRP